MSTFKKNKIIMVNLTSVKKGEGGASHQLNLFKCFEEFGHDVKMLVPNWKNSSEETSPKLPSNVHFTPSATPMGLPPVFDTFFQLPAILTNRIFNGYNILYIRANTFTWVAVLLARILLMHTVVEHNSWMSSERKNRKNSYNFTLWLEGFCQVFAAKLANKSRCVTKGIAEKLHLHNIKTRKTEVIGNGCNISIFNIIPPEHQTPIANIPTDKIIVGYIGGLVIWQGIETLIRAFSLINDRDDICLVIAGNGPLKAQLEDLTKELSIEHKVIFLGYVKSSEACKVINKFNVAVAPFTKERNAEIGLSPIKICDYAACGKTVVSSDIPGITELSEHGWLYVHKPDSPENLKQVLTEVIDDPLKCPTPNLVARKYAEDSFDWKQITSDICKKCLP